MHQIHYVTLDPEKALGVEDLIPSYHIIYSENSQLTVPIQNHGVDIKNFVRDGDQRLNSTAKLLENPSVQAYINETAHKQPNILVFKNDKKIEEICQKLNYNLLNPSSILSSRLENKVEFAKYIDEFGLFTQPKYQIFEKFSEIRYQNIAKEFGMIFVIQFFFGHSGNSTFFIHNQSELEELQLKYPLRKGKVVKLIHGTTYTVNVCITRLGIIVGGISEQLTGFKLLTSSSGGTVGNDFSQRHLNDSLRSTLIRTALQFGEILIKEGYRGIFGLDFVLEQETNIFYLIEANIRQVASCSYYSYIQRMHKQVPIMLWHILELINHNFYEKFNCLNEAEGEWINAEIEKFRLIDDRLAYNIELNQPINASQVLFRNTRPASVKILDQFPSGAFRIRGRLPEESAAFEHDPTKYAAIYGMREDGYNTLCLIKRAYNILEANQEHGFLINTVPESAIIPPIGEIGRIQFLESAFSSNNATELNGWIIDVVNCIYENMRIVNT